jgi:hypothetical protein
MASRSKGRRRRSGKAAPAKDASGPVLRPEELANALDIAATAERPEDPPVEAPVCLARERRLDSREGRMKGAARTRPTRAFRPAWLDQVYVTATVPLQKAERRWARAPTVKTLELQLDKGYPWCTIGRVETTRPGAAPRHGSGVLVGPNLLLTASHVMPWGSEDASVRFIPAYRGGVDPRFGDAYVERYRGVRYDFSGETSGTDYVICRLNTAIGARTGWMGSQSWGDEDRYHDGLWFSSGYPLSFIGGQLPAAELWIPIEDIDDDDDGLQLETDEFTSEGWSGGPLWGWIGGEPRVIGICSGVDWDWPDPKRSMFAGGALMVDLVKHGIANWS